MRLAQDKDNDPIRHQPQSVLTVNKEKPPMNSSLPAPLKVQVIVEYRRDQPEHYEVLISPVSSEDVCVRLHSPVLGETSCKLHRWPSDNGDSLAMQALRSVVGCFFGGLHAAPRIVGTPDWLRVSLEVSLAAEHRRRRMLLVGLEVETPTHGVFTRSSGTRVLRDDVRLCPEDADAVYAVTRLALSSAKLAALYETNEQPEPVRAAPARLAEAPLAMAA